MTVTELPMYKIGQHIWFRDVRLGEFRRVDEPWTSMPLDVGDRMVNGGESHEVS